MNLNSELRPRRELLNPQFEGYKLSLDPLAIRNDHELAHLSKNIICSLKKWHFCRTFMIFKKIS